MKKALILAIAIAAVLVLVGCNKKAQQQTAVMPSQDFVGTWFNNNDDDDYLEIHEINAEENRILFVWFNHEASARRKEGTAKIEDGKIRYVIQDWGEGTSVEFAGIMEFNKHGVAIIPNDYLTGQSYIAYQYWDKIIPQGLEYRVDGQSVTITGYTGSATTLVIPLTIDGLPVTAIGDQAFDGKALTNFTAPSVISIGWAAFSGCRELVNVDFPAATTIGNFSFGFCVKLTDISFPMVTTISYRAFSSCLSLTSVSFPFAVNIELEAFSGCENLTGVSIPSAIEIGQIFQRCESLTSITLGIITEDNFYAGDEWWSGPGDATDGGGFIPSFLGNLRDVYFAPGGGAGTYVTDNPGMDAEWRKQGTAATATNFTRIIELTNPRMNGPDVLALQEKLLSLGFSEIGTADGYYGPMTEGVIKNIQTSSHFEINGKVDRVLWDHIFNKVTQ